MPTYQITAPDGRKFKVTGEGTKEEALAHFQSQYSATEQPKPEPSYSPTEGMNFGQRAAAGIGKAFTDADQGMRQLASHPIMATSPLRALTALRGEVSEEDVAEKRRLDAPLMATSGGKAGNFAGNLALAAPTMMVPGANTVTGSALAGAGLGMIQPAESGMERATNTGLGAGLGAFGQWAGGKLSGWISSKLGTRQAAADTAKAQNATRDATIQSALDAGYSVPPATTNPSALNTALESVAGKAQTQSLASAKNQTVTNKLVRADLGIGDDAPLTKETLKAVRTEAGKAYEAIKQSGDVIADEQYLDDIVDLLNDNPEIAKQFPGAKVGADKEVVDLADSLLQEKFTADAAVEYAKRLRSQAKDNFKSSFGGGGKPETLQLAHAQWNAAGALEDAIERNLQQKGMGELAQNFTRARTTIAKSYSAEAALNEGTGNIVASKLVQQMRKGKPMSGGFETVAKFGSAAPKAVAEPTQSGGVSALNAALYAGGAGLGNPGVLAIPVARLLTKHAILRKGMQQRLALPSYKPSSTGTALLKTGRGLGRIGGPLAAASANASE
jgi:hypothetical protein